MTKNTLKLNDHKTKLVVISSKQQPRPAIASIQVGEEIINHAPTVRNHDVPLDQVHPIPSEEHWQDKEIIWMEGSTETLVLAFMSSKFDYCNTLLHGLLKCLINRLQLILVHNTAAHVVT